MDERKRELLNEVDAAKQWWRAEGCTEHLKMSRAAFRSIHSDFRTKRGDASHPSCLAMDNEGATVLVGVQFVKPCPGTYLNGPDKLFAYCPRCKFKDYEGYEGEPCRNQIAC